MANIIEYEANKDLDDRSLVDFLWQKRDEHPQWYWAKDFDHQFDPKRCTSVRTYLLMIKSSNSDKLIAGIPMSDPHKVILFDRHEHDVIKKMISEWEPYRDVLFEIR